jgi:hypothetical protein
VKETSPKKFYKLPDVIYVENQINKQCVSHATFTFMSLGGDDFIVGPPMHVFLSVVRKSIKSPTFHMEYFIGVLFGWLSTCLSQFFCWLSTCLCQFVGWLSTLSELYFYV